MVATSRNNIEMVTGLDVFIANYRADPDPALKWPAIYHLPIIVKIPLQEILPVVYKVYCYHCFTPLLLNTPLAPVSPLVINAKHF